jgi:hypothetical protein
MISYNISGIDANEISWETDSGLQITAAGLTEDTAYNNFLMSGPTSNSFILGVSGRYVRLGDISPLSQLPQSSLHNHHH